MRILPVSPVHPVVRVHREPLKKNFDDSHYSSFASIAARIRSMGVTLSHEEKAALIAVESGNPTAEQVRLLVDIIENDS